jgi:hypothetical protein
MRVDYTLIRGDSRELDLDLTDPMTQMAYNLAGAGVIFTVDDSLFDAKTVGDGITVDESSGSVTVTLDPEDTQNAPDYRARYRYDVQVTDSAGAVTTPQRGWLIVLPDVS